MKRMKRRIVRAALVVLSVSFALGLTGGLTPVASAASGKCEQRCYRDYRRCVPFCSKNPCFVACETVLDICLGNCGS